MFLKIKIDELRAHMESLGYSGVYLHELNRHWRRFAEFFENNEKEALTYSGQNRFLLETVGLSLDGQISSKKIRQYQAYRAINLLNEFIAKGRISLRYQPKKTELPREFEDSLLNYIIYSSSHLKHRDSTIESNVRWVRRFLEFSLSNNVKDLDGLSKSLVLDFLNSLPHLSSKTRLLYFNAIKFFDDSLFVNKLIKERFSANIKIKNVNHTNYMPVWSLAEIKKLLTSLDRDNNVECRDYAMILLSAILGLRISDILNLKFNEIDFRNHKITITQTKTGLSNILPLPNSIGWAIIDYVSKYRPKIKSDYVFLRHRVPFGPFLEGSRNNFSNRIVRYMQRAGIERNRGRGFHSFRHALATLLVNEGIPIAVISDILGHASSRATDKYISLDEEDLSLCSIDIDEILKSKK